MATSNTRTCLVCEAADAHEITLTKTFSRLGRSATYQRRQWQCDECDEATTTDDQAAFNDQQLAQAQVRVLGTITADDLRHLREQLGLTQTETEQVFGLGQKTVARWETGQRPLPPYIATLVRLAVLHPMSVRELQTIAQATSKPPISKEAPNHLKVVSHKPRPSAASKLGSRPRVVTKPVAVAR